MIKKNWFFLLAIVGMLLVFAKRYTYLPTDIVSNSDSQITFCTQDGVLEQTWQPQTKIITGVKIPYRAENNFSADVQIKIFSDDYSETVVETEHKEYDFREEESGAIEFSFARTAIVQGERYRVQLIVSNVSEAGSLQIASGSNYGGCTIGGESIGQAAAITLTVAKFSRLFWLMAVLLPFIAVSLLLMILTGRKWEETVGLSLLLEGLTLYCFGLCGQLKAGLYFVYILSVIALLFSIYLYNKRNLELRDLLSPGLWIYLFLFLVILVTSNGDWLGNRDELRHWGIAVRDMFYYDAFANHLDTTLILTRYLPFAAILEYVFEYMNGMFSEDILLIAYQTMLLSVSIILYKPLQKKWKSLLFPITVSMICVPVLFFNNISSSIMVDSLLAMMAVYVLICYYSDEMSWFNRIRITSGLLAMTLTKDIGLVLAGIISLIIFVDILVMQIKEKKMSIKRLMYPVICVVGILVAYASWQLYLSTTPKVYDQTVSQGTAAVSEETEIAESMSGVDLTEGGGDRESTTTAISASGITIDGVLKILTGEGEPYQYQITRNYLIELLEGETYSFGLFKISFMDLLAMIGFLIVSLGYFGYWQADKSRMYAFVGGILLGSLCLCAFLQLTYWFTFPMYEGLGLTSIDRYLAPYICAVTMAALYFVFDGLQYDQSKKIEYLAAVLSFFLIICMPVKDIVVESKDREDSTVEAVTYGHNELSEILRSVAGRGERAYFICSNSDGFSEYIFRNAVCPIISKHENWNIVPDKEIYMEQYSLYGEENIDDNVATILSKESWKEELQDCQYVVIFHADELFRKSYVEFFENELIEDGSVYQVVKNNDEIELQIIGTTGIKGWH